MYTVGGTPEMETDMVRMTRHHIVLVGALVVLGPLPDAICAGQYVGREFPDLEATDALTGQAISLADLRGKAVLVDFWATWCGSCKRELPNLQRAYEQFHDEGLEIVSISLDYSEARFKSFVDKTPMNWHHVMEGGGWKTRLAVQYGIHAIPKVYLLASAWRMAGGTPAIPLSEEAASSLQKLGAARAQLQKITEPVQTLSKRMAAIAVTLQRVERALSNPAAVEGYTLRLLRTQDELHQARHRLFMLGVLGEQRTVSLPAETSDALAVDVDRAKRLLSRMQASIEEMTAASDAALDQLTWLQMRISDLRRELATGRAAGDLQQEIGAVRDHALELAEQWCEPWVEQVATVRQMLALAGPPREAELAALDALAAELSRRLEVGADVEDLRLQFSDLARRALTAQDGPGRG